MTTEAPEGTWTDVAADLAEMRQYPPCASSHEAACYGCHEPVSAGTGVLALVKAAAGGGGAILHRECAKAVRRVQERQRTARLASQTTR
jgi:hypothetical protein